MAYLLFRRLITFLFKIIKKNFKWIFPIIIILMILKMDDIMYWTLSILKPCLNLFLMQIPEFFALLPSNIILFFVYFIFKCVASLIYTILYFLFILFKIPQIIMLLFQIIIFLFVFLINIILDILTLNPNVNVNIFNIFILLKIFIYNIISIIYFIIYMYIYITVKMLLIFSYDSNLLNKELLKAIIIFGSNNVDDNAFYFNNFKIKFTSILYFQLKIFSDFFFSNILLLLDYLIIKDNSVFFYVFNNINFPIIDNINENLDILKFTIWFIFTSLKFFFFFLFYPFLSLILLLIDFLDTDGDDIEPFLDTVFFFSEYVVGYRGQYYPDAHANLYIFSEKIQSNSFNFIKHVSLMYFDLFAAIYKIMFTTTIDLGENLTIIFSFNYQFNNYINHLLVFEQIDFLDFLEINHPSLSTTIKSIIKSDSFIGLFTNNINIVTFYSYLVFLYLILSVYYFYTWMDYQIVERTNDLGILDTFIDIKNYIKNIFYKYFFFIILFILFFLLILFFIGIGILYVITSLF